MVVRRRSLHQWLCGHDWVVVAQTKHHIIYRYEWHPNAVVCVDMTSSADRGRSMALARQVMTRKPA